MTQAEYEKLTNDCDDILKQFINEPSVVAIPWLHVLNNHPNSLHKYRSIFHSTRRQSSIKTVVRALGYFAYKLSSSLFRSKRFAISKADVLLVSHYVNNNSAHGRDFYYGHLAEYLSGKGISCVTGLIDHTPGNTKSKPIDTNTVLFSRTISFSGELKIARDCFRAYRLIRSAISLEKDKIKQNLLHEAAIQALSPETCSPLRIRENINSLLKQATPAVLITTWEGWSWERLAVCAAKTFSNNIHCIGYQHTILFPGSHALKKSLGNYYDPAVILTVGDTTKDILGATADFQQTEFIAYGSHRMNTGSVDQCKQSESINFLVTPEGIESECVLLFSAAKQFAERLPKANFIFRMHPVLPYSLFATKYPQFASLPANCQVSEKPDMQEDFNRCNYLLYRGSSVAVYAVSQGLRPVYYSLPGELSIDPLYAMNDWRLSVTDADDFAGVMQMDRSMSGSTKNELFKNAGSFCRQYVLPVNYEIIHQQVLNTKK